MTDLRFCTSCGNRRPDAARFCGACGVALIAPPTAVPDGTGEAPFPGPASGWDAPPPGGGPGAAPSWQQWAASHGLSRETFTRGDWIGAVAAAAAGVGSMVVLSTVAVLLTAGAVPVLSSGNVIAMIAMVVALAFGGTVSVSATTGLRFADTSVEGSASVSISPLLIIFTGLVVIGFVYLRRLRSSGARPADAAAQAVRLWIVLMGMLVVVGLVGRTSPTTAAVSELYQLSPDLMVTTGIAGTLVGASVWLALTLGAAVIWRMPALLPPRLRGWRNVAGGPTAGAVAAVVVGGLVLVLGVPVITALTAEGSASTLGGGLEDAGAGRTIGVLLLAGPHLVLGGLEFAVGVPLALSASTLTSSGFGGSRSVALLDATDRLPQVWFAPLAVGLAIVLGGVVAALHASSAQQARRTGWLMGATLGVIMGIIAVAGGVSVSGSALGLGGGGRMHLDYLLAPLLGLAWGALGGWIGALLAAGLPEPLVTSVRARIVRSQRRAYGTAPPVPAQRPTEPEPTRQYPGQGFGPQS